jgi:hypothetical protein
MDRLIEKASSPDSEKRGEVDATELTFHLPIITGIPVTQFRQIQRLA